MLRGDLRAALELTDRAAELARAVGAGDVLSDVLNTRACALHSLDVDWADDLAEALRTAVEGGHTNQAGRAYTNIFGCLSHERRFAEAERVFEEGVDFCDTKEMGTFVTCLRGERTNLLRHRGHWPEAAALAAELLGAAASPINRINALLSLGLIRAARGDDGVWTALDEAVRAADGSGEPYWIVRARLARAEAAWLEGRDEAAVHEAEAAADVVAGCDAWLRGATAVWLRRVGAGRTIGLAYAGPYRQQVNGDPTGAARQWQELGCPYEAALALVDAGTDEAMRDALAIVDGLGATAAGRVIRRAMRRRGIRSIPAGARTATRAHPFGLTRRESEVLDLIADGRTNAEIAASLFISAKTVDHHVSAVLAKLEAPTRAVAATKATRLGLLGLSAIMNLGS
jgi:DNA-binding CsgD family transcriptional regulator